jgi:hypothetical protein
LSKAFLSSGRKEEGQGFDKLSQVGWEQGNLFPREFQKLIAGLVPVEVRRELDR